MLRNKIQNSSSNWNKPTIRTDLMIEVKYFDMTEISPPDKIECPTTWNIVIGQ
jgi:hypothetical protein